MPIPDEFAAADGKPPIALVTGGARRIGAAFVRALAAEGFQLAIHCHASSVEAEALATELAAAGHPRPLVLIADLAEADVGAHLLDALPACPRLLVNNASLFQQDQLQAIDTQLWQRQMAVNLLAPVRLMEAMARRLPQSAQGLIVNLLDAKLAAPNPDYFSYTLSKFGLAGASEMAARALAPGIRVNAIAPSVTLVSGPQSRDNFAQAHVMNPLGRGVMVEDLVRALLYLLHTPSVTGQTLVIDGGQRFLALPRDVAYMVER